MSVGPVEPQSEVLVLSVGVLLVNNFINLLLWLIVTHSLILLNLLDLLVLLDLVNSLIIS
jgi:hypothetical protein